MTQLQLTPPKRLPGDKRAKSLLLAIHRIQRGTSHTKAKKLTFGAVALEAGVSTALIFNHYPKIADAIRLAQGKDSRRQFNEKRDEINKLKEKIEELKSQLKVVLQQRKSLVSINETLRGENDIYKAAQSGSSVVRLPARPKNS